MEPDVRVLYAPGQTPKSPVGRSVAATTFNMAGGEQHLDPRPACQDRRRHVRFGRIAETVCMQHSAFGGPLTLQARDSPIKLCP